ncbi:MAG: LysM peptidoglycan-binding domain-containing protein [Anaerolineae bacterium]|uniref:LysM peptidoglycan-binding domain-containing protein n=1 Tax=Promineifilum sp. TaxID=2664178 RepID=UPI001DB8071B|nr:LysM peptidoglycan-binding domain-containing protein [Anaerolineales bacterium]MCB8935331.1 LysM peptidoglycan-binding domain-containing protein [Promineifilum sp.]MCO5180392.1 LysM peptidoglycan-binding domain-containing protein [Promineifilum sp.]MCW5846563.1 LysM peptidoglycan-binding domain-containing protein [Anaerolineae bacterium]
MSFRQMLPFVFLNVIVSAVVVLSILFWWDNRGGEGLVGDATTTAALPEGVLATPNIAAPPSGTTPPEATTATADEPVLHTVQAGETLNIISQQYDVSIDDIMAVNGMDNPNFIAVGQQLTIPIGGIPEPTAAPTEAVVVVALPSPIPTEPAAAGGGVIGVTGIIDPGILETEAVQLVNSGAQQQSIQGWKVRDEDNNVYTFGDVSIFGDGAGVLLHTRAGDDTFSDLHWGLAEPAWRSGETLTLWDAGEQVVATFVVP